MRQEYFKSEEHKHLHGTIYKETTLKRIKHDGTKVYHTRYVAEMSVSKDNVVRFRSSNIDNVRHWIREQTKIKQHQKFP